MIVIGQKYKFTKFEKERLKKKKIVFHTIKYIKKEIILSEIKDFIMKDSISLIVMNTKVKVDDEIIKYLTNVQFENNIAIMTIERFVEDYLKKCYIPDDYKDLNYLDNIKPFSVLQYIQKRFMDYIAVFILILVTWPILLYAKKKIKEESPGDCIFKQSRVGEKKVEFKCLKFRSMHLNSYHDPYTRENDDRIFPWGNIMRKTRIDELPQLLNVLKGDMHFIGPRAEWNILVKEYENKIPYYNERHLIRPGITGWAQVNYPYGTNIEDTKQKLMYDLYYIKHWSILLDLKVIWKTILVVLGKRGV